MNNLWRYPLPTMGNILNPIQSNAIRTSLLNPIQCNLALTCLFCKTGHKLNYSLFHGFQPSLCHSFQPSYDARSLGIAFSIYFTKLIIAEEPKFLIRYLNYEFQFIDFVTSNYSCKYKQKEFIEVNFEIIIYALIIALLYLSSHNFR